MRLVKHICLLSVVTAERCLLENGNPTIFMSWHGEPESITSFHMATVESVLFHYPASTLVMIGRGLGNSRFLANDRMEVVQDKGYCVTIIPAPDWALTFLHMQIFVYQLQIQFGGLYVPFAGALLNTIEYVVEPHMEPWTKPIFFEILNPYLSSGFTLEEMDEFEWKRPQSDLKPNTSFPCAVHCLRFIPKNCSVGIALAERLLSGNPDLLLTQLVRGKAAALVLLPSWLMVEPKFPDRWAQYGSSSGFTDSSSDLFAPRQGRYRYDIWYVMSHKLWLPWFAAKPQDMNVVDLSVVALVRKELSLNLFTDPFSPLFAPNLETSRIKSPLDRVERLMNPEQIAMRKYFPVTDVGLPGTRGGYKTFQFLRFVGNEKVLFVEISAKSLRFFCRTHACEEGGSITLHRFTACGSQSMVNAAVSGLGYKVYDTDDIFSSISVSLFSSNSCAEGPGHLLETSSFNALAVDVEKSVTVIAHSGGRCEIFARLEESLRIRYGKMKLRLTCECETTTDDSCPTEPALNPKKSSVETSWYDVPHDFGLSRGKSFLISTVDTEFVLVLDDDFTLGFNSCIECLVIKLKSRLQSSVLPLDIVGFPVLEDERMFGAFRGSLRVQDSRLSIEPYTLSSSPDGCMRLDICPMVFLARTERISKFSWDSQLPVGEHELFFYENKLNGAQVAVCADAAFIHHRVQSRPGYDARRSRQGELMSSKLAMIGIAQTYYFFTKHSHQDELSFHTLLSSNANPYLATRDAFVNREVIPGPFRLCYIAVLSRATESGQEARFHRRKNYTLLSKHGICEVVYLVPSSSSEDPLVLHELDQMKDILFSPSGANDLVRFILEFFSKYMFHLLFIASDSVKIEIHDLTAAITSLPNMQMKVILGDSLRGISRDLFFILSHPMVLRSLGPRNESLAVFDILDTFIGPFLVDRVSIPTANFV